LLLTKASFHLFGGAAPPEEVDPFSFLPQPGMIAATQNTRNSSRIFFMVEFD